VSVGVGKTVAVGRAVEVGEGVGGKAVGAGVEEAMIMIPVGRTAGETLVRGCVALSGGAVGAASTAAHADNTKAKSAQIHLIISRIIAQNTPGERKRDLHLRYNSLHVA
jgi:hypothetical protein